MLNYLKYCFIFVECALVRADGLYGVKYASAVPNDNLAESSLRQPKLEYFSKPMYGKGLALLSYIVLPKTDMHDQYCPQEARDNAKTDMHDQHSSQEPCDNEVVLLKMDMRDQYRS